MDNNTAATSDEKQPNWSGETTLSSACYGNRHDSCGAEAFTGSADAVAMPPPLSYQCTKTANCWVTTGPQLQWFSCLNTLTSTVLSDLAATSLIFWKPLVWERDRGRKRKKERTVPSCSKQPDGNFLPFLTTNTSHSKNEQDVNQILTFHLQRHWNVHWGYLLNFKHQTLEITDLKAWFETILSNSNSQQTPRASTSSHRLQHLSFFKCVQMNGYWTECYSTLLKSYQKTLLGYQKVLTDIFSL